MISGIRVLIRLWASIRVRLRMGLNGLRLRTFDYRELELRAFLADRYERTGLTSVLHI